MDTGYQTIKSLIELLVKKAGFDVEKNYGEEELEKTRSYIFEFECELKSDENKEVKEEIEKVLNNLKKREEKWKENAEVLGKNILSAYKENKKFNTIKEELDKLVNLALKDKEAVPDSSLMSYVYDTIKTLEEKKENIERMLESGEYKDTHSKQMDEETLNYLNNKIIEYDSELKYVNTELERLRNIETKDISTISSIKVYMSNTLNNLEKLENVKNETMDKEINTDIWAKLEKATIEIKKKYNNAEKTLKKFEKLLESLRENREEYLSKKAMLEESINKCRDLIDSVKIKMEKESYADYTNKVLDENKNAVIKTTLEELKNKKEVIYVNVNEVKNEIIKEWSKIDSSMDYSLDEETKHNENEDTAKKEENEVKDEEEIKELKEEPKKEKKKIEFDW